MGELNINPKKFPVGSVVYYVKKHGHEWSVSYGTVEEHYYDTICVQLYEPFDARLINGIPIKQFETPTRWSKLPKGWTYNTKLFSVEWAESKTNPNDYDMRNPDDILRAIADGVIVKVQDNDHAEIQTEIDNKMGWRITRKYPSYKYRPILSFSSCSYYINSGYKVYRYSDVELADDEDDVMEDSKDSVLKKSVSMVLDQLKDLQEEAEKKQDEYKDSFVQWAVFQERTTAYKTAVTLLERVIKA